jgi:hypothetical protein
MSHVADPACLKKDRTRSAKEPVMAPRRREHPRWTRPLEYAREECNYLLRVSGHHLRGITANVASGIEFVDAIDLDSRPIQLPSYRTCDKLGAGPMILTG